MGTAPSPFHIEELLAHAEWLRRLASHLVRGSGEADDLVQETWVAALRAPPRSDRAAQPWLGEVLRNFARRAFRTDRARARREAQSDRPSAATPEGLLERAEAQRLLAALVVSLEEPFRSTVMLRYFEGLTAAEIARSQGVPAGTVRWRLKEGLARLRLALDERHGGDRRAWLLLLAPLESPGPVANPSPREPIPWAPGGLTLAIVTSKKVAGASLVVLVLLLAGGLLWRSSPPAAPPPPVHAARPPAPAPALPRVPAILIPAGEVVADGSPTGSVEGQVVSAAGGAGIGSAELGFSFGDGSLPVTADGQGRFRFAPRDSGVYLLARVSAPGFVGFAADQGDSPISFALRPGERIRGVRLALRSVRVCRGTVIDETGKPMSGARISTYLPGRPSAPSTDSLLSDAQGRFEFTVLEGGFIEARHDGRSAFDQMSYAVFFQCELRLRLQPPRDVPEVAITGRVEGTDGRPLPRHTVEAWANPVLHPARNHGFARTVSAEDGSFSLSPLDPIPYALSVASGGRELAGSLDVRGGSRDVVLRVPAGGRLRGLVKESQGGQPVAIFSVVVSRPQLFGNRGSSAVFSRYDARGAFELEALPAGPHRVVVVAEGRAPSDEQTVEIPPDPATPAELVFALREGGRVHGIVTDRATGAPLAAATVSIEGRAGVGQVVPLRSEAISGPDGRFDLRGVGEGHFSLLVAAEGHHGRVVGGLEMKAAGQIGPLSIDLAPTRAGETPRIELIGIGASLASKGDAIVLGGLAPDGGAARAGLVTGDAILSIDGRSIKELGGLGAAVQRIRGAEGTSLLLRVRRASDGQQADVVVTRRLVRGP